jgi:hypothetical protein
MALKQTSTISATDFIQKLHGRSQALLVEGNDQHKYVVKWMQGPRATVGVRLEALRSSIYQAIGLPVSQWTQVTVTDELIDAYPEMWIDTPNGLIRPEAGIQYGTRLVGDSGGPSFESLPYAMYPRVKNRSDFWGAYVADVWTERFEPRQAVFVRSDGPSSLKAVFIDHGCSIASLGSKHRTHLTSCLYPDRRIYIESQMIDDLHDWIDRIQRLGRTAVVQAHASLPPDWMSASVDDRADHFIERIGELQEILFPSIACVPVTGHSRQKGPLTVRVLLRTCQIA